MKKVALYVRVSTEEQKKYGLSVDAQITELKDYATANGCEVYKIYNDAGISARKKYTKRPALLEMIEDANKGCFDEILITKLDRFFRSVGDYYAVMDKINVPWRAIQEDYETVTSAGVFKVNIMLSVAQSEADRTSERVKNTFAYKAAKGDYVGSAAIGYKKVNNKLIIDEKTKDGVTAFFREYLRSFSKVKAVQAAKEHGVSLTACRAQYMLKSPTYAGNANGYKCEAYITQEEHAQINNFRHIKQPRKNEPYCYLFVGMCKCDKCGRTLSAKHRTYNGVKGSKRYVWYEHDASSEYENKCEHIYLTESTLEAFLIAHFDGLVDRQIETVKIKNNIVTTASKALQGKLESKLQRLTELYAEGDITKDDYKKQRDEVKAKLAQIHTEEPITSLANIPSQWKDIYNGLTNENKRAFWRRYIKKIIISADNKETPVIIF